jgi:flagellar motility protein MotE (MotC chaperone)
MTEAVTGRTGRQVVRGVGRGALVAIACLFLGSGLARFASGPAIALAEEAAATEEAPGAALSVLTEDELVRLLADLAAREANVTRREREAETRLAAAELAETRAREAVADLEAAEAALRATMALADGAAEADLAQLTAMYEAMKPQQASPLFQQMAPDFAAGFLGRMRPDAAAAILAGLSPESAYAISVILAGRNADIPRSLPPSPEEDS